MERENKIKILKQFFDISVAAFEMQHTISKSFGYLGTKSYMHLLHMEAQEEINKDNPDLKKIDMFLSMMESAAEQNPKPNFEKGSKPKTSKLCKSPNCTIAVKIANEDYCIVHSIILDDY